MTWSERQALAKKQAEEEEARSRAASFKPPPAVSVSRSFGGVPPPPRPPIASEPEPEEEAYTPVSSAAKSMRLRDRRADVAQASPTPCSSYCNAPCRARCRSCSAAAASTATSTACIRTRAGARCGRSGEAVGRRAAGDRVRLDVVAVVALRVICVVVEWQTRCFFHGAEDGKHLECAPSYATQRIGG